MRRAGALILILAVSTAALVMGGRRWDGSCANGGQVSPPARPLSRIARQVENARVIRASDGTWRLRETEIRAPEQPWADTSDEQLEAMLLDAPERLGPASIGAPNHGWLRNGVTMPPSPLWEVQRPDRAWGTPATVQCLQRAVTTVQERYPESPRLVIGDLSLPKGGYLFPHRSHQSGRDADIGYYYVGGRGWYEKATHRNLDRPRTWALVRALVTDCDLEYLFIDAAVQAMLREYALAVGEDEAWLDDLFAGVRHRPAIIRHAWGHRTHLHVRVYDEDAERIGARLEPLVWRLRRDNRWR